MSIDRTQLLALWPIEDMPACDEGMELAVAFLDRAGEAVSCLDEREALPMRNALIRAHKAFIEHRSCPPTRRVCV
jgi:hypothetical protein